MNKNQRRIVPARHRWNVKTRAVCAAALLLAAEVAPAIPASRVPGPVLCADADRDAKQWIGTWATAAQPFLPKSLQTFQNQTLRLIVHTSIGGTKVRIKISNTYGVGPLLIGGAHVARRTAGAEIDPRYDRTLKFHGKLSTTVAAGSMVVSDSVELNVPALPDLAISLFLPQRTEAKTSHSMAKQTGVKNGDHGSIWDSWSIALISGYPRGLGSAVRLRARGTQRLTYQDTQAVCGFRCWASKHTPFFQTISTIVAIFLAKVRRAICGRIFGD